MEICFHLAPCIKVTKEQGEVKGILPAGNSNWKGYRLPVGKRMCVVLPLARDSSPPSLSVEIKVKDEMK